MSARMRDVAELYVRATCAACGGRMLAAFPPGLPLGDAVDHLTEQHDASTRACRSAPTSLRLKIDVRDPGRAALDDRAERGLGWHPTRRMP